ILPEATTDGAIVCCKRIQALLESTDAPVPQLQVYLGIAAYSAANATAKAMLSHAEKRLEEARTGNGERVVAEVGAACGLAVQDREAASGDLLYHVLHHRRAA